MKFMQLRRKIENEFEELYPKEEPFAVGTLEDISGKPMRDTWLIGDHLR